jgi:ankyrin repeat protein
MQRPKPSTAGALVGACILARIVAAEAPTKVDFRSDIQPLLKQHCVACHGPSQQKGGLRLDQRGSALKARSRRLLPGSSATSRLYLKLLGSDYGLQMPPTGALAPEQIRTVKDWIDQGADWPDALAGDPPPPQPPDPAAARIMEALRNGDRQGFRALLRADPKAANRKGPGGSTPLMHAALYGDTDAVRLLLEIGADPSIPNQSGATALMWAVGDVDKTRLLLAHGADANARSEQGQTPLSVAAGRFGSSAVIQLLLDHGADPSPGPGGDAGLRQAADAGDATVFRMLVEHGAAIQAPRALTMALRAGCSGCAEMLIDPVDKEGLNSALVMLAPFGDVGTLKALLDHGAEVDARLSSARRDLKGRTPLMLAASSDYLPAEAVKMLIDRGADVGAKGPEGETALDLAKRNGDSPVTDLLRRSGALEAGAFPARITAPDPAPSARGALGRSLPLLQRSDVTFIEKAGCVSCHNNTLTAMTVAVARAHHLPLDESVARAQRAKIAALLDVQRDDALLGGVITNTASNTLVGLAAEQHPPDIATDAMAYLIKGRQLADGRWRNVFVDHRPPLQGSDIEVTATSIRALRVYAPRIQLAEYQKAIDRGSAWLTAAVPRTTDERALRLLGFRWAGFDAKSAPVGDAARALLADQRPDGGWAQLPSLASDAYATGQVLVALNEAGALRVTDPAYRRGVDFLLGTQLADGSWYVKTRSLAFQPYFESGFPHGPDQWISMAASNWASMALALTVR